MQCDRDGGAVTSVHDQLQQQILVDAMRGIVKRLRNRIQPAAPGKTYDSISQIFPAHQYEHREYRDHERRRNRPQHIFQRFQRVRGRDHLYCQRFRGRGSGRDVSSRSIRGTGHRIRSCHFFLEFLHGTRRFREALAAHAAQNMDLVFQGLFVRRQLVGQVAELLR